MALGKVYYVDVVTDTCSIRCIVPVKRPAINFLFIIIDSFSKNILVFQSSHEV